MEKSVMKIYLSENGNVATLDKDFPIFQGQYDNIEIEIYVPMAMLTTQYSVDIGCSYLLRNGIKESSRKYFVPILDDNVEVNGINYARFRTAMPSEFSQERGYGVNATTVVVNVTNLEEKNVDSIITSQEIKLNVLPSTRLDETKLTADELTYLKSIINNLQLNKQDKEDQNLKTPSKYVVEAINQLYYFTQSGENNLDARVTRNTNDIANNRRDIDTNTGKIKGLLDFSTLIGNEVTDLTNKVDGHTTKIDKNIQDIADIKSQIITSLDRIGRIAQTTQPTSQELTAFVVANTEPSRQPQNGDYVEWLDTTDAESKKLYNIYFKNGTWGEPDEVDFVGTATNRTYGTIKGTYADSEPRSIKVNIIDGIIEDLYFMANNGQLKGVGVYLKQVEDQIASIISGGTPVEQANWATWADNAVVAGEAGHSMTADKATIAEQANTASVATKADTATKAINDSLNRKITETYAEKNNVYTKDESDDKFLTSAYSKIYYYAKEGIVDVVPTDVAPQFSVTTNSIGNTQIFDIDRVLRNKYTFNKNSTDNSQIWVSTDRDCNLKFRLTTYAVKGMNKTPLAVDVTAVIKFTANSPKNIEIKTIYNQLLTEVKLNVGDRIEKKLEVITDFSDTTKIDVYSNTTYPSTFFLVAQSITFDVTTITGKKRYKIARNEWIKAPDNTYYVTISSKMLGLAPSNQYGMDLQYWNGYAWQRVLFSPTIDDNGNITIYSAIANDFVLLVWVAVDIDKINEGGTRFLVNGEFIPEVSLPENLPALLEPIDLGSVKDGVEFDIAPSIVESMFTPYDKTIHLKWSNYNVSLIRFDRSADKVFYSANMELEGTKYLYTLTIDKTTNKGLLERVEEDIIVDMGEHTLKNGATFNISLANASKRNVVYIKIFDKNTNRTRFFKKNWIDKDNTTFTFSEMWNSIVGQIVITTAEKKAVYNEVVLADKDTASAMANRLKFNQLLDTASSTLPTANGLVVTNIYGGHHVVGTTDRQYYHKMYELATTQGHWYYFAPNFSDTKSVYILGHIDSTTFSTNKGKVFEGGSKFDAYIQIEKEKTMDFDVQPILVDLTEMFGEGNEPQTEQDAYKYFTPNIYYPYNNPSELVSIDAFKYNFEQLMSENDIRYDHNGKRGIILTHVDGGVRVQRDNSEGIYYMPITVGKFFPINHVYYFAFITNNKEVNIKTNYYINNKQVFSNQKSGVYTLIEGNVVFQLVLPANTQQDFTFKPILIDLTDMFGAGNEPSTVEELYQYIVPNKYYPYGRNLEPRMYCTKAEANKLSMCPSDTVLDIQSVFSKKGDIYIPPANGYIFAYVGQGVPYANLDLQVYDFKFPFYVTRASSTPERAIFLPVTKGMSIKWLAEIEGGTFTVYRSKFIYAKELKI